MRFTTGGILALAVGAGLAASAIAEDDAKGNKTGVGLSSNVSPNIKTIHVIRDTRPSVLETRTYKLKHADPYTIAQILREALATIGPHGPRNTRNQQRHRRRNQVVVTPLKYEDGTGAVIVTAPKSVFKSEDNDKHTGLDNIIRQIDKAGAKRIEDSIIHYQPRHRSASRLSKIVENMFREKRVIISMDPKSNDLLLAGPPSAIKNAVEFLKKIDIAPQNYLVNYRVLVVKLAKSMPNSTKEDGNTIWIDTDFKCSLNDFDVMEKNKKAVKIMSGSLTVSSKKSMIIDTDKAEEENTTFSPGCSMKILVTRPCPEIVEFNIDNSTLSEDKGALRNKESHVVVRLVADGDTSRAVIGGGVLSASGSSVRFWLRKAFGVADFNADAEFQMVLIVSCRKEELQKSRNL